MDLTMSKQRSVDGWPIKKLSEGESVQGMLVGYSPLLFIAVETQSGGIVLRPHADLVAKIDDLYLGMSVKITCLEHPKKGGAPYKYEVLADGGKAS